MFSDQGNETSPYLDITTVRCTSQCDSNLGSLWCKSGPGKETGWSKERIEKRILRVNHLLSFIKNGTRNEDPFNWTLFTK